MIGDFAIVKGTHEIHCASFMRSNSTPRSTKKTSNTDILARMCFEQDYQTMSVEFNKEKDINAILDWY